MPQDSALGSELTSVASLPATTAAEIEKTTGRPMPLGLRLWFDDRLFDRARLMAKYLSQAAGITPKHLLGKPEACFFVVEKALVWNLSPSAVAAATFQIDGADKIGYEGKLCHAILEQSGRLKPGSGGISYEHFGPWDNVDGKFTIATSSRGKDYAKPVWTKDDIKGVGVYVAAHLKEEDEPRKFRFLLVQAYPLNSTLWATDPRTQIQYLAVRRFANSVVPQLLMGVPFEDGPVIDHDEILRASHAYNIAPAAPTRADFSDTPAAAAQAEPEPEPEEAKEPEFVIRSVPDDEPLWNGDDQQEFARFLLMEAERMSSDKSLLDALWESNSPQFTDLREPVAQHLRDNWPAYKPATQQA